MPDKHPKAILLICYSFPPFPGIGGRRWAKFVKYLCRNGYQVHVITAKNSSAETSEWLRDVEHKNIILHTLPRKYPAILSKVPTTLFEKVEYKLWMKFFQFYSKGTLFDRSVFWKPQLEKKASELIQKFSIRNVLVTIPPFKIAHHATALKNKFPEINLIVDYRDPWTDNRSFHGFKNLSENRLNYEVALEDEVLQKADKIITVSEEMTEKLIHRGVTDASKFLTINNGFDPDDLLTFELKEKTSDTIEFIYAGSLYSNLDYLVKPLLDKLKELKEKNNAIYKRLSFSFYGNQDEKLKEMVLSSGLEVMKMYGQIPIHSVFEKINAADFCLLFSAPDHAFAFNTKFFEYLAYRRPILLFSNKGKTSDFIEGNGLGYVITPTQFNNEFDEFINKLALKEHTFNANFDSTAFTVKNGANEIEKLFI
jgi:glycosyltransferase involved in cell wall biosynthesis